MRPRNLEEPSTSKIKEEKNGKRGGNGRMKDRPPERSCHYLLVVKFETFGEKGDSTPDAKGREETRQRKKGDDQGRSPMRLAKNAGFIVINVEKRRGSQVITRGVLLGEAHKCQLLRIS